MLSVQPLKSAEGAANYYAAAFNYYAGDAQALRWLGKGAEYLGLSGVVEKEQMLQLLEGKLPNGQVLQNKKGAHRPGFDMTYSAPKSVSIIIGLQADPKLEQLHDLALERAISRVEKEFAQARVVIDGKVYFVDTGKLVVAAFRQPSSRANDPATHTHGVTMNITITDEDGKARSLASDIHGNQGVVEQLQQYVTYGGLVYRTELANLMKENNYRLEDIGKGMFEIAGFSKEVLREFSTRRVDIEDLMHEKGWEGARLASKATLLSRPTKEEQDINILRADWKARADKLGFDAHQFVKNHKEETIKLETPGFLESLKSKIFSRFYEQKDLIALEAKEAVFVAIESISQKESVFSVRDLKEAALRHTLIGKTIVPIQAIEQCIEQHIDNQSLYEAIDPLTQRKMLTTPWALTLETETLARIHANQGVVKPIASNASVIRLINEFEANAKYGLTPSQKNALVHTLTSSDRFQAVQGYAGAGKTTMLQLTKQLTEEKGFRLRGMAVTSSAVNELRNKAGMNADVFPIVHQELLRAKKASLQNTIFILDEASMLSTIQGHELVKLIEQKGGRLILVGDDAQLSSVKCGRIFGQAQEYGIQTSKLTEIIRQTNEHAKASVTYSIEGELHNSIQHINEVRALKTHEERISEVAHRWLSLSQSVRDRTLVFAPTHANRQKITAIMREGLKKEGTLSDKEFILSTLKSRAMEEVEFHHAQYYQEGDVLRFNLSLPKSKIKSGDYLTVDAITEKHREHNKIPLIKTDGTRTLLRLKDLPKYEPTRAGLNRIIECYEQRELALCTNDKILITRNNRQGLVNSELALVKAIDEAQITLVFEKDGRKQSFPLDAAELKHLDHGYVLTTMKVQGKDKTYAIGLIESYNKTSATLRNYYVQISRAIVNMTLITDDKTRLIKALELNDDTKKTALDYVSGQKVEQHEQRFEQHPNSIPIAGIKSQKFHKEQLRFNERLILDQYLIAKKENKKHLYSKYSWAICTNPDLKKLAQVQLGVSEATLKKEALPVQTLRLIKELNQEEQAKLRTVKSYLNLSNKASRLWKSIAENPNNLLQKKVYFDAASKRNELAYQIVEQIEKYKPYLEHCSIGKTNRLGLSQYRIEKEEQYAIKQLEKLGMHAEKHQVVVELGRFFKEQHLESKESLAVRLKEQSKKIHPYLIRMSHETNQPLMALWSEINHHAKNHEEKQFSTHLNPQEKAFFNLVKEYKSLNRELATQCSSKLYCLEKGVEIPKDLEEQHIKTVQLRNQIAGKIQSGTSVSNVLDFFKLDEEKLTKQTNTHNKRETVLLFKESHSNFKERTEAAITIAGDIKGFYPLIKELGINTKRLNAFIRVEERKAFINELSDAHKVNYLKLIDYKSTNRKAGAAWNRLFQDKEQGQSIAQERLDYAQKLTAKRNRLAYVLHDKLEVQALLEQEKIHVDKIKTHANQHKSRLEHVKQMRIAKEKLLHQLEHRVPQMNQFEARTWHKSWGEFKRQMGKITSQLSLYEQVLTLEKNNPLHITKEQQALLNKYELGHGITPNNRIYPTPNHQNNRITKVNEFLDAKTINESLLAKPEETYRAIFGEPKKTTPREMRYSGGLIVSLKGAKSGFWYDFSEGVGGSPLQAIMRERGMSFHEAIKEGASISGNYPVHDLSTVRQLESRKKQLNRDEEKNKIRSAKSIVKGGISIKNTLAERYLKEHRGIEHPERLHVLFWPKGAVWKGIDDHGKLYERINKIPALLIPAYNEKNEVTGVQRIYLDSKTGKKNTFMEQAKLSQGIIEKSAGILQKSEKFGTLYLAEGPETGASIAMANPQSTVLVSLGLSNLKNLNLLIKRFHPKEVIIAGDNDTLSKNKAFNITHEAQNIYKDCGIDTRIIMPKSLPGMEKTDWNDVHKTQGLSAIREQLGIVNKEKINHDLSKDFHQEQLKNNEHFVGVYERFMTQSNKVNTIINRIEQQKNHAAYSSIENNNKMKSQEMTARPPKIERSQKALDLEL